MHEEDRVLRGLRRARQSPAVSARFEPIVLCYHAVSESWGHRLSVPPEALESQVRQLLRRRYRPVAAADLLSGSGRTFHVTFDDAFRSTLDALPVLERLRVPATVFACSKLADGGLPLPVLHPADEGETTENDLRTLDWDGLRELGERGIEVGSHSLSHPFLTQLSDAELDRELRESRARLESELGRRCRFVAYPYGDHDERVRDRARAAGYEAGFALPGRAKPFDRFGIPRIGIWRKDGSVRVLLKTSAARRAIGALRRWR
jgi:peptidoglycan/xylan/chitin deacetylase (PgdA/CDA1 family)